MRVSNFRLGIGVPLSFHTVEAPFFRSFIAMDKPPFVYIEASNGDIAEMRNSIVRDALHAGCTHLVMTDTDQVYHPDTVPRLLSHRLPVVGCLVYRRYPPFDPLMLSGKVNQYRTIDEWEPGALVEVDATGAGCLCIDMQVFRSLPYPWFRFRKGPGGKPVGEDIGFCSDLRELGYRIFVDTSVPAGHLSQIQITETTWRRFRRWEKEQQYHVEHGILKTAESV